MLKYVDVKEVFAEIPNEITLAISISGCPIHCKGCHSQYLWADVGEELTVEALAKVVDDHFGVTCVCFMGGDNAPEEVNKLAQWVKENTDVKTAWYSGRDEQIPDVELRNLDYLKIGRYDESCGPLTVKTTNQVLWLVEHGDSGETLKDITHQFWNRI